MNNNEQTTQNNDFEIIDIPVENNDNAGNVDTMPNQEIEQLDFDVEPEISAEPTIQDQSDLAASEIVEQPTASFAQMPVQDTKQENGVENSAMNVYTPSNDVKQENTGKQKMAKSTKELIVMAVLAALIIILLPNMYNLTSGNYHITDKIKNSITGLFGKKDTAKQTENTNEKEEVKEETTKEETTEEKTTEENTTVKTLSFDFSSYNNQIIDRTKIQAILDDYKNNIVELNSTVENNIQTINIKIAKDKTGVTSVITNPDTDIANFKTQNLSANLNYLVTVTNVDSNITTITAVQK